MYSADGARHKLDHLSDFSTPCGTGMATVCTRQTPLGTSWTTSHDFSMPCGTWDAPQCVLGRRRSVQAGSPLRFLHALWHWDGHSVYSADGARHKLDHLYDFSMPCGTGMATVCTRQTALGTSWITSTISPCPVALGWPQYVLGRRRSAQAGSPLRFLNALWHWDGHSVQCVLGRLRSAQAGSPLRFLHALRRWDGQTVYSADGARHKLDHLYDFSMPCGTGMATVCTRQTALGTSWITSTISPCPVALGWPQSVYSADGARHKLDHLYDFSMPCGTGMAKVCTRQTALGTSWITSTISPCPVALGWPQCVLGRRRSRTQAGSPLRFLHALWHWDGQCAVCTRQTALGTSWITSTISPCPVALGRPQCVLGRRRSAQAGSPLYDFSMPCGTGMAAVCTRQTALGTSWITSPISPCPVALGWPQCVLGRRRSAQAGSPLTISPCPVALGWPQCVLGRRRSAQAGSPLRFLHPCATGMATVCTRQTALGTSWITSTISPCPWHWDGHSVYSADGARHKLDHLYDFSMPCGTGMATVCTRQTALGTSWITSTISPCPVALGWPQCVLDRRRSAQAGSPLRFLHALWHWDGHSVYSADGARHKLDHLYDFSMPCGTGMATVCTRQTALGTSWITSTISPRPVATGTATVCTRQTALGTSWITSTISPCHVPLGWPQCVLGRRRSAQAGSPLPVALGWPQCVLGRRRSAQAGSPLRFLHALWHWDGHSVYSADGARHKLDHLYDFSMPCGTGMATVCTRQTALGTSWITSPISPCPVASPVALGWPKVCTRQTALGTSWTTSTISSCPVTPDGHSVYSADGARHKLDHLYDFSMPCGNGMATVCTRQTALGTSWTTSTISTCPAALGWPQCVLGRRRSAQAGSPLRFLHALWRWDGRSVYSADGARHKLDHLYDFSMPCGTGMATVCTRQTALGTSWITSTISPCPVALRWPQCVLGKRRSAQAGSPLRFLHALRHWGGRKCVLGRRRSA